MRPLTILVDMDDTIEYLLKAWVAWLNHECGTKVNWQEISEWDMTKNFPMLTPQQIYEPLEIPEFWDHVKPIPYATEMIHQLIYEGHDIFIVTSTNYKTLSPKMEKVLFRYFPYLSFDNVIVTSCKRLIKGDILIDDGPHNLLGSDCIKLLMDAPHNQKIDEAKLGARRVHGWEEIYNVIHEIADTMEKTTHTGGN